MGKSRTRKSSKVSEKADRKSKNFDLDELFLDAKKKKEEAKVLATEAEVESSARQNATQERQAKVSTEIKSTSASTYGRIASKIRVDPKITNPEAPIHRWDKETGLPVYKAAALKAFTEESGGGPDCPFDCNCCF
jgi:hypothetical protein